MISILLGGELKKDINSDRTQITIEDALVAETLASIMGDTYIDFASMSPSEPWARILSMLRQHGTPLTINITNNQELDKKEKVE